MLPACNYTDLIFIDHPDHNIFLLVCVLYLEEKKKKTLSRDDLGIFIFYFYSFFFRQVKQGEWRRNKEICTWCGQLVANTTALRPDNLSISTCLAIIFYIAN